MKSLAIILVGLYLSWRYTNIHSEQPLYSVWAPLACMFFLLALVVWAFSRLTLNGVGGSSGGSSGGFDSGSDCGGSDGGSGSCD